MSDSSLEAFFDHSLDLLFIADPDGRFERVNPAFTELLGYAESELRSRRLTDFVHPDDLQKTLDALDDLRDDSGICRLDTRVECADGSVRWLAWRIRRDPDEAWLYGTARETTREREVDRLKDEFVSVVSHELRTPLTSIRGSLGLALKASDDLPEQTARLIEIAEQNSQRLEMLVDDILDIEKIASGDLDFDPEPVAPGAMLQEVADSNRSFADQYEVNLETDDHAADRRIRVDRDRLFQILTNFVSNAIKYSPEGGSVTLSSQPVDDGDAVRLAVTDRGEGIPESFRDQIFDRFTQADASTTRRRQGTGLGLSIAKALTEQMGGEIDFVTELGEGTTFFVDFPAENGSSDAQHAQEGTER